MTSALCLSITQAANQSLPALFLGSLRCAETMACTSYISTSLHSISHRSCCSPFPACGLFCSLRATCLGQAPGPLSPPNPRRPPAADQLRNTVSRSLPGLHLCFCLYTLVIGHLVPKCHCHRKHPCNSKVFVLKLVICANHYF